MQRRLFTNDPTMEKLHELLSQPVNGAGLTLLRDELAGFFANLTKPGREGDRALFLECHNGSGSYTIDRVGRGSVHAEHLCLSIFGSTQPERLRRLFNSEINDGESLDGLMQRFQILVYPDFQPAPYVDHKPDGEAIETAQRAYAELAAFSVDCSLELRFSEDAQKLFIDFYNRLVERLQSHELNPSLRAHFSKYPRLMAALALLFALADGECETVGVTQAKQAAAFCDYLEQHAKRVYSPRVDPAKVAAIRLGEKLRKGWRSDEGFFSVRDVYQKGWSGLSTPDEVRAALLLLEDKGWVRPVDSDSRNGRPSEQYAIHTQLAVPHDR